MEAMFDQIQQMLDDLGFAVCDSLDIPARSVEYERLPKSMIGGPASEALKAIVPSAQVWSHQARALRELSAGKNVVISTGTASGKSLIFQLYSMHRLLSGMNSRVLVFYPLRALTSDQLGSWKEIAKTAGLGRNAVDLIFGGVPEQEREQKLKNSRVVLMTPDVCQSWLMRRLDSEVVRSFLADVALMVIDEAHVYESVFGSNSAYLFRRLLAARRRLTARGSQVGRLQVVAATATIDNPVEHMRTLVGMDFSVVAEEENGAPRSVRRILHVDAPETNRGGESLLQQLLSGIHTLPETHRFIAFMDSRQGVERVVRALDQEEIKPYRSGYENYDRISIQTGLKNKTLHGVVSTSALELGIDIADMDIGLNLGEPVSRKSFHQRLGRIGRHGPGVFLVVAPRNAFAKYGEGLQQFYESSVEPSLLYLGNRFVQYVHSRCLIEETELLGVKDLTPVRGVQWPDGFLDVYDVARHGGAKEFEAIAQVGRDAPHFNYPLRQLGDHNVKILGVASGLEDQIGDMSFHQALLEAYPGATYLHLGRMYKVNQWNYGFNEIQLKVAQVHRGAYTRPILRKTVNVDLTLDGIIDGRVRNSTKGIIAEAKVRVNEEVNGFRVAGKQFLYRDLRVRNPSMRKQQRPFNTTGIVLRIDEEWFTDNDTKRMLARSLLELISRERGIASQDVDEAHSNIALESGGGISRNVSNMIVVYDTVYGGLRLTESLFDDLSQYLARLKLGAGLTNDDGLITADLADRLTQWESELQEGLFEGTGPSQIETPEGWLCVYRPRSTVSIFFRGSYLERELMEPSLRDDPDNPGAKALYYRYVDPNMPSGRASVPDSSIVPTGQDWDLIYWNPDTGEFRELADAD